MLVNAISFFVGWILGCIFYSWCKRPVKAGVLFFYNGEDEDMPTMAAGLDIPVEEVRKHDEVTFKVSRR